MTVCNVRRDRPLYHGISADLVEQAASQLDGMNAKVATNRIASIPLWHFVAGAL